MIEADVTEFKKAYDAVVPVVPKRTPKDVLRNVRLDAGGGVLRFTATDGEMTISHDMQGAATQQAEAVLLPAERTQKILQALESGTIRLTIVDKSVKVKSGGADFRLSTESETEFPPTDKVKAKATIVIPNSEQLRLGLQNCVVSTDNDSTRYALAAICFEIYKGDLLMVSTDSRRLTIVNLGLASITGELGSTKILIPNKAAQRLIALLSGQAESVVIDVSENMTAFTFGGTCLQTRHVEGRFPRWQDIADQSSIRDTKPIEIAVRPVEQAIRQAVAVSEKAEMRTSFEFKDGNLTVEHMASESGAGSTVVVPVCWDREGVRIEFDAKYILDSLGCLRNEPTAILRISDGDNPIQFETESGRYRCIVMPLSKD